MGVSDGNHFRIFLLNNFEIAFNLRVRFFKKIQDWILKSENGFQINPRSLGSWCIKGSEESLPRVDFSVPLTHHDPRGLGLICLEKKREIRFLI